MPPRQADTSRTEPSDPAADRALTERQEQPGTGASGDSAWLMVDVEGDQVAVEPHVTGLLAPTVGAGDVEQPG